MGRNSEDHPWQWPPGLVQPQKPIRFSENVLRCSEGVVNHYRHMIRTYGYIELDPAWLRNPVPLPRDRIDHFVSYYFDPYAKKDALGNISSVDIYRNRLRSLGATEEELDYIFVKGTLNAFP